MTTVQLYQDDCGKCIQVQLDGEGYVNATRLCTSAGKSWAGYARNDASDKYPKALARSLQICTDQLIKQVVTGHNDSRGTWVHKRVAIHLAQWICPEFAVWVTDLVDRFATGQLVAAPPKLKSFTGLQDWRWQQCPAKWACDRLTGLVVCLNQ